MLRRLMLLLAVLLVCATAPAQVMGQPYIFSSSAPQFTPSTSGLVAPSPVLLTNGTEGAPALAPASATGYGWYFTGGNTWRLSFAGSQRMALAAGSLTFTLPDVFEIGDYYANVRYLHLSRAVMGGKSKTLTDAGAAVAVWSCAIPTSDYLGGELIWTAKSTDATDFRATQGVVRFAGVNKAGATTCTINAVGTDLTASSNANTLVCTWTNVTSTTNCNLSVTCTDNTAGTQTMSVVSRLDMPIYQVCAPQ